MASIPIGKWRKTVSDEPAASDVQTSEVLSGKGRPTPTRREREAANLRPLVQTDRKAANRDARAVVAQNREKARLGMAAGDERFLTARDRGVQRRFVRDYVDARWSIGEFLLPVMFAFILVSLIPSIAATAILFTYGFFVLVIIDMVILGFLVRRRVKAKFGENEGQRWNGWYAAMRTLQLRPLRLPKPQVKRGARVS